MAWAEVLGEKIFYDENIFFTLIDLNRRTQAMGKGASSSAASVASDHNW